MILGITATRKRLTAYQADNLERWICDSDVTEVHHGDCIGGDEAAHAIALEAHKQVVIHPPDEIRFRAFCQGDSINGVTILAPKPYLQRNHAIVDACEYLLALPGTQHELLRSGTWATIRYARKTGKPYELLTP